MQPRNDLSEHRQYFSFNARGKDFPPLVKGYDNHCCKHDFSILFMLGIRLGIKMIGSLFLRSSQSREKIVKPFPPKPTMDCGKGSGEESSVEEYTQGQIT